MKDFQTEIDAAMADPVRRARIEQYGREIDVILDLSALREAVGVTQEDFAAAASMSQENVSRIERATDVKLSTIRRLARTAGEQLELNAVFPNGKKVSLFRPRRSAHDFAGIAADTASRVPATAEDLDGLIGRGMTKAAVAREAGTRGRSRQSR